MVIGSSRLGLAQNGKDCKGDLLLDFVDIKLDVAHIGLRIKSEMVTTDSQTGWKNLLSQPA